MVSREMIQIILKAEDQASEVVKKNDENIKRFGETAKQANQKAANASQQFQQKASLTSKDILKLRTDLISVGQNGKSSFNQLTKSEQDALIKFNMLDKESQQFLASLNQVNKGCPALAQGIGAAQQKFISLDNVTKSWSGSMDYNRSRLQLLGTDTDSLKGKIQVVGSSITTYLGTKWDNVKTKVTSLGDHIKTKLTSALSTVRTKLDSLGSAFSGLGGMITSAIGMLGMASINDLTIGLSLSRERMTALTNATTGSAQAADNLINGYDNLNYEFQAVGKSSKHTFEGLDTMTTHSLVSLDDLGQAMSNFKMATGASNDQLAYVAPTINDIGQRAILMGKSSDEALSLMQGAAQGLNGNFMTLKRTFGVSKEALENLGWSGAADDVEGYTDALNKYLEKGGSMDEMMDTTVGHMEELKKNFRIAGRHVGDMFTPAIDDAVVGLNNLNDTCPGLFEGLVEIAGGVSMFATLAPTISPMLMAFDNLAGKSKGVLKFLGLMKAEEGALTLATIKETAVQKASAAVKYLSGIATAVYGGIVGVLTGEIGLVTAAQQVWNAVMAANPIGLVIVALLALGAAIYAVGKYFGWWENFGDIFAAIRTNVMRLWDAFIHNPNVQGFIKGIGDAWNWLLDVTKPVVDWLKGIWVQIFPESAQGQWDVTRALIEGVGFAFNLLSVPIKAIIKILQLLWPYLEQFYQTVLVPLGQYLITALTPVFNLIGQIIQAITPYIINMGNAFSAFLDGQITFSELLGTLWNNLDQILRIVFSSIMSHLFEWAGNMVNEGINAAGRFIMGVLNRIGALPHRFAVYLWKIVSSIISAGISWVNNAKQKASDVVNGVMSFISQLPGKFYNEFMNIGKKITDAGKALVDKAKNVGSDIVNGILNAMGIHSPGIIQTKIATEFQNMVGRVREWVKPAGKVAEEMGNNMVDSFGNPTFETNIPEVESVVPNASVTLDTSLVNSSNGDIVNSFDNLALQTGNALQSIVDSDKSAYDTIKNNDVKQLSIISSNLQSKMSNISNTVKNNMNSIVDKNKSSMVSVNNNTKNQLNSIVTKTKSASSKMISSWNTMKDGIVNAANKIKSDSTTHFNKLENTIGGFYRKLQNPGGFGAGPSNGTVSKAKPLKRGSNNGFSNISKIIRTAQLPSYLTYNQIKHNPFVSSENIGSYITPDLRTNKFNVSDLIRSGNIKIPIGLEDPSNKGAGGWSDGVKNHTDKIKNTSNKWGMKGPKIIGKYATNVGFKVKDFLNGAPTIDFSTFKTMAENVFSQCHYDFYYDSNKYGNWMTAFEHGYMNCSDSTDALIAMANACGLSASKIHGHWNQYGHYWANIAGHKMDTTGWMNQRNWTPSASHAGPAPKGSSFGFNDFIKILKDIFDKDDKPTQNGGSNDEIYLNGEVKITHEFLNLPENISADEIARLINETSTDENWIKSLVKNGIFQKWDLKEKQKIEFKQNRAKGVLNG